MTVTGIATREPERYVTRAELAALMGVSVKTVDRLVADGMPSVVWGKACRRFRPSVAIGWARAPRSGNDQPMITSEKTAA